MIMTETLEEILKRYPLINQKIGFKAGVTWQQERSYSEEEVLKLLISKEENTKDSKKAVLHYRVLSKINDLTLVKIQLETGRSHQIRVQFSSRNAPLWGDQRYNKDAKPGQQIALWASSLTILHPTSKEEMTFTSEMPSSYPWNIFKGEK